MSSFCDYLYASGFRFKSGTLVVNVSIEGRNHNLAVVRNGKGRSRTDRWAEKPIVVSGVKDVVGEISLRDLSLLLADSGRTSIDATSPTGATVTLDPEHSMGRSGRSLSIEGMQEVLYSKDHSTKESLTSFLCDQLDSMPYGDPSKESSFRLNFILHNMSRGDLFKSLDEVNWEWMRHATPDSPHIDDEFLAAVKVKADTPERVMLCGTLKTRVDALDDIERNLSEILQHINTSKTDRRSSDAGREVVEALMKADESDLERHRDMCRRLIIALDNSLTYTLMTDLRNGPFWIGVLMEAHSGPGSHTARRGAKR